MIGPTGVGKTEIARRLAQLADAPFIKVEATKFTEVGYVGRDVDSIIRDLAEIAIKQTREQETHKVRTRRKTRPKSASSTCCCRRERTGSQPEAQEGDSATRQKFRKKLREGELDDKEIEIDVLDAACPHGNLRAAGNGRPDRRKFRACFRIWAAETEKDPQAENPRGDEAPDRRRGRQARQRRGD